jgi:hypothetical protein
MAARSAERRQFSQILLVLDPESKYKERKPLVGRRGIMKANRVVVALTVIVLLLCPGAVAQVLEIVSTSGESNDPNSGTDISTAVGNSWNVPPYDCTTALSGEQQNSVFVVTKLTPPCLNVQYSTTFTVTEQLEGAFGITYQVGCDTGTGELTSSVGICEPSMGVPCSCLSVPFPLGACSPDTPPGNQGSCNGSCTDAGTCSGNVCTGDAGRACFVNADCKFCGNNGDVLCDVDENCEFVGCGALRGFCSDDDTLACVPPSIGGGTDCTGICIPASCGSTISGRCDDNPNRNCTTAADCGRCTNAPLQPCEINADCDFGTCEEGLTGTDSGQALDFFGIGVRRTSEESPDAPTELPMVDPWKAGLLIVGLLTIGIALILRRVRFS